MTAYLITSIVLGALAILINLGRLVARSFVAPTAGGLATAIVLQIAFMAWASWLLIAN